jgi:hypothetical protein
MHSLVLGAAVGLAGLLLASPTFASQCPKLVKQIQDATAIRFDPTAAAAKTAAAQATALHTAGQHAESEKVAKDALEKLGVKPGP